MNKRIEAAMDKAARISDRTHQGHVLEGPESKFEAGIQDIIGLLGKAENTFYYAEKPYRAIQCEELNRCFALIKDARRKLEEYSQQGVREVQPSRLEAIQETKDKVAAHEDVRLQGQVVESEGGEE